MSKANDRVQLFKTIGQAIDAMMSGSAVVHIGRINNEVPGLEGGDLTTEYTWCKGAFCKSTEDPGSLETLDDGELESLIDIWQNGIFIEVRRYA